MSYFGSYRSIPIVFKVHQIRYILIPILSLILVHLVAYGRLPFEPDYQFPTVAFLVILFVGLGVCETNRFNFIRMNKKVSLVEYPVKRIFRQVSSNLFLSSIVFILLTISANLFLSGTIPSLTRLLSYLFIVSLISFSETITFIAWEYYKNTKRTKTGEQTNWLIKTVNGEIMVNEDEISCLSSTNGIVTIFLKSGKKIITNYNSLRDVESLFDLSEFFQINRQLLIKANVIHKVTKDLNRKLKLEFIEPIGQHIPQATISRYKNAEFRDWLKSA